MTSKRLKMSNYFFVLACKEKYAISYWRNLRFKIVFKKRTEFIHKVDLYQQNRLIMILDELLLFQPINKIKTDQ